MTIEYSMSKSFNRRSFLAGTVVAGLGAAVSGKAVAADTKVPAPATTVPNPLPETSMKNWTFYPITLNL